MVLLAALGGAEVQVKSHVEGALKAGNTKEEVVCALVHASGYMGFPAAVQRPECEQRAAAERGVRGRLP